MTLERTVFPIKVNLHKALDQVKELLTAGGDTRILIDKLTGLTHYKTSPYPNVNIINFNSSTANTISFEGYKAAEKMWEKVIAVDNKKALYSLYRDEMERVRNELENYWGIPGTTAVITASGTDGEILVLSLVLSRHKEGLLKNIIIAPNEIGSGIELAAKGRHFSDESALGGDVIKGAVIDGFPSERVIVESVELRDKDGSQFPLSEVDAVVIRLVEEAVISGHHILLHVLDCSKTGIGGPTPSTVKELKSRFPKAIDVVVDACQGRISKENLAEYLRNEFMVLTTGSKFFGGPPFSGVLLLPPSWSEEEEKPDIPEWLKYYSARSDWPLNWREKCKALLDLPNLGLLLRWKAALCEMAAFARVPENEKCRIIHKFMLGVSKVVKNVSSVALLQSEPLLQRLEKGSQEWDAYPTIFTLELLTSNRNKAAICIEQARKIYNLMVTDISALLPSVISDEERNIAKKAFALGQPLKIGDGKNIRVGLRISLSARDIIEIYIDDQVNAYSETLLKKRLDEASSAIRKLDLIIKYL
jgi:hypothetical protein